MNYRDLKIKNEGKQVPKKSPTEGKQQAKKSLTKSVRKKKKTPAKTTTLGTGGKRDRAQREGRASARNGVGGEKADATEAPTNKTSINCPEERRNKRRRRGVHRRQRGRGRQLGQGSHLGTGVKC